MGCGRRTDRGGFSPDGSLLAMRTPTGGVGLLNIDALRNGATPEEAMEVEFTAHNGVVPDNIPFSPDSSLFATWGLIDRHIRIWRTEDGQLVAEGPDGTLRIYTLDHDELVQIAKTRLTRGFTEDECATYHIDPCPTLEDLRSGSA